MSLEIQVNLTDPSTLYTMHQGQSLTPAGPWILQEKQVTQSGHAKNLS